jgi:transcriptional repressor NrdR
MYCPYCSNGETKVLESRLLDAAMRRRRECLKCMNRFTTYEHAQFNLKVEKKNGNEEEFNLQKISSGIERACGKISQETIHLLSSKIQRRVLNRKTNPVKSTVIGKIVLAELKKFDKMAYLRFATVYKKINDPHVLEQELAAIQKT